MTLKKYIMPDGKPAEFSYDDNGIGSITLDCMDMLMGEIAKLTAERDALLADVKDYQGSICCYCKHIVRDNEKKKVYCGRFGDFPTSDGMPLECGRWEWRGVNHD